MSELNESEENFNIKQELASLITDETKQKLFRELTTILTRRWKKGSKTVFGVSEVDLLVVTRMDIETLQLMLTEYEKFISILGLQLVAYQIENEKWYCLRSDYYAPPELKEEELIVLGVVISMKERKKSITSNQIREMLVEQDFLKEYQVNQSLRNLDKKGYLKRDGWDWEIGYRTDLEYDQAERKKILDEFEKL